MIVMENYRMAATSCFLRSSFPSTFCQIALKFKVPFCPLIQILNVFGPVFCEYCDVHT